MGYLEIYLLFLSVFVFFAITVCFLFPNSYRESTSLNVFKASLLFGFIVIFLGLRDWSNPIFGDSIRYAAAYNIINYDNVLNSQDVGFSIIFNKPFIAIGNKNRGLARFKSLLSLYGLENRLNNINLDSLEVINWAFINDLRVKLKEKSFDFLKDNLDGKYSS